MNTSEDIKIVIRDTIKLLKERANTVGLYPTEIIIPNDLLEVLRSIGYNGPNTLYFNNIKKDK